MRRDQRNSMRTRRRSGRRLDLEYWAQFLPLYSCVELVPSGTAAQRLDHRIQMKRRLLFRRKNRQNLEDTFGAFLADCAFVSSSRDRGCCLLLSWILVTINLRQNTRTISTVHRCIEYTLELGCKYNFRKKIFNGCVRKLVLKSLKHQYWDKRASVRRIFKE